MPTPPSIPVSSALIAKASVEAPVRSQLGPGLLFVQVDGLSWPALEGLIAQGAAPNLAGMMQSGRLSGERWTVLMPTTTPASQAGILHGRNDAIPAFRWYDKVGGRLITANHPSDAAAIERRVSNGQGLLALDGVSIGNLLSGDAPRSYLTMATVAREPRVPGVISQLPTYFLDPRNYVRLIGTMFSDAARELWDAVLERRTQGASRTQRDFSTAIERAVIHGFVQPLSTALVKAEMKRGAARIFVDYTGYDVVAHHGGPVRAGSMRAARQIDREIGALARLAAKTVRPYVLVVLSDHGQSPASTFRGLYGEKVDDLVARLVARGSTLWAATEFAEHLRGFQTGMPHLRLRLPWRRTLSVPQPAPGATPAGHDVVLCASGNLAQVYLTQHPGRVPMERIAELHPGLIEGLRSHPAVGLLLMRRADGRSIVLAQQDEHLLDDGATGSALTHFGDESLRSLRRLDALDGVGDVVIISALSPGGEVISFEELVGAHGGLGGAQSEAFVLYPSEWEPPSQPIVGAVELHDQLERWFGAPPPSATGDASVG